MMKEANSKLSTPEISAALSVGIIGLLILGLQPILLGELLAHNLLSLEGLGLVAMGEIVALGVGVLVGDTLLPIIHIRTITAVAALTVGLLDISALRLHGDLLFGVTRAGCGLAEGVLVWVATCNIVRSHKPDKIAGVFLTSQTVAQALVAGACALLLIPRFGWKAGFLMPGLLALLALLVLPLLRHRLEPLTENGQEHPPFSFASVAAMLVVFLQMSAIGALWPYLEPIGRTFALDPRFLETLVSLVLLFQIIGGTLATFAVGRMKTIPWLLITALLQALVGLTMFYTHRLSEQYFGSLWAMFGLFWLFAMPFHIRLALLVDSKGRVAMLVPALQLLGTAFGPLLSSVLVSDARPRVVALICAGFALSAAVVLTLLLPRLPELHIAPQENTPHRMLTGDASQSLVD